MELELRHLRRLVAIADAGSLTGAARALGVAEEALVAQLRRMEAQLGEPLFVRGPVALAPTPKGREVLDAARVVLVEMSELVAESRRGGSAAVRLAGPESVLAPVAARFAALRPGVPLTTRMTDAHAAAELLRDGAVDACATLRWPSAAWPVDDAVDVQVHEVDQVPLELLLADAHRLAGAELLDLADLAGEPWCVRAELAGAVVAECVRHGFEPDVRYRLGSDEAVAEVVATGGAVALVAHPPPGAARGVVVRPYREPGRSRLMLAWSATAVAPDVARHLVAAIEGWYTARTWAAPVDPRSRSLGSAARPLRIGSIDERATIPTVPRLRTVHGLHSVVEIAGQADLLDALGRGELDLALCQRVGDDGAVPPGTAQRVIAGDEPLVVALAAGHPLAGEHVALGALAGETWAVRAASGEADVLRALGAAGAFEPRIGTTYTHSRQVAAAVASGRMVRLADGVQPEQGIVRAVVRHPAARRTLLLVWPADGEAGDVADLVAEELRRSRAPYVAPYPDRWP